SAILVDFLPGPAPGYPIVAASFQGIARELDLSAHWQGFTKPQSVEALLDGTFTTSPEKFAELLLKILEVTREHNSSRKHALSVQDLEQISACLNKLDMKIPQLESDEFLKGLPQRSRTPRPTQALQRTSADLNSRMRKDLVSLTMLPENEQGYALEL